ncbi:MAG: radical SAM protein [Candidatus Thermoplasmatota archaeon]|nr:radical SAM protein [Candidatus Thermoplasmatota archaeon]
MLHVSILDGYVDEPTCLGVPPYISPYPRYIAGAVWDFDPHATVSYITIDQLRNDSALLRSIASSDVLVVIAGMSVPGRYLSGYPVSPQELVRFFSDVQKPVKLLCGPAARYGFGMSGGKRVTDTEFVHQVFDIIVKGDGEIVVSDLLKNKLKSDAIDPAQCRKNPQAIKTYAIRGAALVTQHPFYPDHLITEIETYRGCPRSITGGCSFCSEPSKGVPSFRTIKEIYGEITALYTSGIRHFRIGNQPCLFSYLAHGSGEQEFPRPNPAALEKLFSSIRTAAPDLKTLHIDNANPGVIARYPKECRSIAKSIIKYHTPGDIAAFGVESVDPVVIKKNNLKASAEEIFAAIRLLNEVGSRRGKNGLPELLPGLNFVFGLDGETKSTFALDYNFLKKLYEEHLLVRRINLRQVIPIPGTRMYESGEKNVKKHKAEFQRFKRKVRETIERPMLQRLAPEGTLLSEVFTEAYEGKLTFARQMGSYPLLVGIPGVYPLHRFYNVKIVAYGYRSLTGIPFPLDVNTAPRETLEALPGVGRKRAIRILAKRPFQSNEELARILDDPAIAQTIEEYVQVPCERRRK